MTTEKQESFVWRGVVFHYAPGEGRHTASLKADGIVVVWINAEYAGDGRWSAWVTGHALVTGVSANDALDDAIEGYVESMKRQIRALHRIGIRL